MITASFCYAESFCYWTVGLDFRFNSAAEMTYIVSGGTSNSTQSLIFVLIL